MKRDDYILGLEYKDKKDYIRAKHFLEKSANNGNKNAMLDLAILFEYIFFNKENAVFWYKKAANSGSVRACYNLGLIYELEENYIEARDWYKRAGENDDYKSIKKLADYYYYGYGCDVDYDKARALYEKGAALDNNFYIEENAPCLYMLGYIFENGNGVQKDLDKAYELYASAAELDYFPAYEKLGDIYRDKGEYYRSEEKYKYASKNSSSAIFKLGLLYTLETPLKDFRLAKEKLEEAYNLGNSDAAVAIGDLYFNNFL